MRTRKRVSVVCLILSIDKSPWKEIQERGQDQTFAGAVVNNLVYLRYSGHHGVLPFRARMAAAFKIFQHRIFLALERFRFIGLIAGLSLWRIGDSTLRKSAHRGLPETHLRRGLSSNNPNSPDTIVTDSIEHSSLIGLKTLKAFQFVVDNYDFDFVFRTNSSSYIDGDLLVELTKHKSGTDFYGGFPGRSRFGPFASGAGILISKSIVEKVLENSTRWRHGLIDDVALSKLIQERVRPNVTISPLSRDEFQSPEQVSLAKDDVIKNGYHFRCKAESPEKTIQIMKNLWIRKGYL